MKKIVASAALAVLVAPYVSADTTVVTAHEEPAVVVDQQPAADECCKPDFGGIGVVLGIGGSFLKVKSHDKRAVPNTDRNRSKNVNRFIGTVGLTGGKVFKDKFYLGTDLFVDFTKNKNYKWNVAGNEVVMKSNGIFTTLGLRAGYIIPNYNTLLYVKVAGSHSTAKYTEANKTNKCNKIVPALALGVEKAFCKKFTARLEGEYRFRAKKTANDVELKSNNGAVVRALVSYNVRF